MAAELKTLIVHYKPRKKEGEPFKLKLTVPPTKTVAAVASAFVKAVAKSDRGYGLSLDATECFVNRMDDSYVRPETLVSELENKEELRLVRRDDVPEKEVDTTNWATPRPTAFWISNMKDDGGI